MIEYSLSEQAEIPAGGDFAVKVIGVGGAGANVLDRMALEGSEEAELLTLNTDIRALSTSVSNNKIQLGKTLLKGMGAGGDPELGQQAALEAVDEIRSAIRGYKMAFVCVGLGGGTGSGAAPEVARIAKEEGVFLVAFATLPFNFEGRRRMDQALDSLERISKYANAVITFENDRMGELIVPKEGVQQAFAAADKIISQSIRATMSIVSHPGIIRIGMDDLLSALDSTNSRCLFGFGQAKGDNRAHEALEQALKCPLLDKGKLLQDARNVLVHIGGGDSMTLYEIQLVMQELSKHIDDSRTQILFGTGTDKKLGANLTVTIVSSLEGKVVEGRASILGTKSRSVVDPAGSGRRPDRDFQSGQSPGSLLAHANESAGKDVIDETPLPVEEPLPAEEPESGLEEEPEPEDSTWEEEPVEEEAPYLEEEPLREEPVPEEPPRMEEAPPPPPWEAPEEPVQVEPAPEVARPEPNVEARPVSPPESRMQERTVEAPVVQKRVVQSVPVRKAPMAAPAPEVKVQVQSPAAPRVETRVKVEPAVPAEVQDDKLKRAKVSIRDLARRGRARANAEEEAARANEAKFPMEDAVVAETEDAQKITLSRLVPGGGGVNRPEEIRPPVAQPPAPSLNPAPQIDRQAGDDMDEATAQQQQMLQLEPLAKGRFAKTEPTIVDGEDVDVPTFLRKRRK